MLSLSSIFLFLTASRSVAAHPPGGPKTGHRGGTHDIDHDGSNKTCEAYGGVDITYKETFICETTPRVKGFAGYVHLPSELLADSQDPLYPYNLSVFFWYFQARHDPENAPLILYFAGGPGESSMYGAALDDGPCTINPDANSTTLNPHSFNNHANVLYIDQPAGAGFSYQTIVNSTYDLLGNDLITPMDAYGGDVPPQNTTFRYGLFPDQNPNSTVSSTPMAARQMWAFLQTWLTKFPEYKTRNNRINLFGNSYGGFWSVGFFSYFQQQNTRIQNGEICGYRMHLDTVGVTNGCIDSLYSSTSYPEMAYNNTYGVEFISEDVYNQALFTYTAPGGCQDLIVACREIGKEGDPDQTGLNATVNDVCVGATAACWFGIQGVVLAETERNALDLAQSPVTNSPPYYIISYMQKEWVQEALGVPLNFTEVNNVVAVKFFGITGDPFRFEGLKALEYILDSGINVALVYGDRDYRCNWIGGENVTLHAEWEGAESFRAAGYESITTSGTYTGGLVRQYGRLSFTRLFQSGHDAAWFQPETVSAIMKRAIFHKDIATGEIDVFDAGNAGDNDGDGDTYSSTGLDSSFAVKGVLPPIPPGLCQIWHAEDTCSPAQLEALLNGTAVVVDDIVVVEPGPDPVS